MSASPAKNNRLAFWYLASIRKTLELCLIFYVFTIVIFAQISISPAENTMIVDDAPDLEVIVYGKNVTIRKRAKGVLAIGGDITVEGRVEGDAAAVGGSIYQREKAFIGGDVFVLGGKYKPERASPLRTDGKETVMYAAYEEELRGLSQNPLQIFAPSFSVAFFAQRLLSVMFWFAVTFAFATVAPGAVSRAIARFKLSALKIFGLGFFGLVIAVAVVTGGFGLFPNYLGALFGLMAFVLLLLAYVFGRVTLQVSTGQLLQKTFLAERQRSESLAIILGVVFWAVVLSVPYLWILAVAALFSSGVGLVLTAGSKRAWTNT